MGKADKDAMAAKIAAGEEKERKEKIRQMKKEMKKKRDGFFADFKKFITRGNVLDMAVGVIVGGAFTAIVNGLSNFVLKPVINWLLLLCFGDNSLESIYTYLHKVEVDVLDDAGAVIGKEIDLANSIYIDWGSLINAIINFFLIALVLFLIVRTINNVRKRLDAKDIAAAAEKAKAEEEKKKAEEAAKAEAAAAAAAKEQAIRDQFYANVARQTELLEQIAKNK